MRRLIWLPLAGALLIAGAAVATAAPTFVTGAGEAVGGTITRAGNFLQEVLAELVDEGVIEQDQSDAIAERVDERLADKRAEFEARREEMRAAAEQLHTFLEDDVISQDELEQLPTDHPLRNLDSYLEDGQLTREELRQLGGWGGRGFGGPGRGHFGPGWNERAPSGSPEAED